jgi:3-hydroxyacyl-CoA dehydrogenase
MDRVGVVGCGLMGSGIAEASGRTGHDVVAVESGGRRAWSGTTRTRPAALIGDKAHSSRGNRALLRTKRAKRSSHNQPTRSCTANAAGRPAAGHLPLIRSLTRTAT